MKNKIIMLLSAALLLTSLSAFAEATISSQTIDIKNASVNKDIKNSLQNAYDENQAKESDDIEKIKSVCKNNQYCTTSALMMLRNGIALDKVLSDLRNVKDHKQNLYLVKRDSKNDSLLFTEIQQIMLISKPKKISSKNTSMFKELKNAVSSPFNELKNYMMDVPLCSYSFALGFKKLKGNAESSKELKFIDSFVKKYPNPENPIKEDGTFTNEGPEYNVPVCPEKSENLDMSKYGYDNLCVIPCNMPTLPLNYEQPSQSN